MLALAATTVQPTLVATPMAVLPRNFALARAGVRMAASTGQSSMHAGERSTSASHVQSPAPLGFEWGETFAFDDVGTAIPIGEASYSTTAALIGRASRGKKAEPGRKASSTVISWYDSGLRLTTAPMEAGASTAAVSTNQKANEAAVGSILADGRVVPTAVPPASPTPEASVSVVVSVDWEGSGFEPEDMAAFCQFREDFPHVPITHFLNAAYFTRLAPDDVAGVQHACNEIRSVLRDGDEIGLHVHADNHLLYAADVTPKRFPSWNHLPDMTGHSVPLSSFSEEEVRRIVNYSCRVLVQHGFDRPVSFRAGGWHAGESVLSAVAAEGFTVDSSEVPHDWPGLGSFGDVAKLWPNATRVSQPYRLESGLVEVPDNGCLADYLTSDEMVENFEAVVQAGGGKPVVLALGFHQETAAKFLPRLCSALVEIEEKAEERCIPLHYQRTDDVALGFEADAIVEDKSNDEEGAVAIYKKELVFAS